MKNRKMLLCLILMFLCFLYLFQFSYAKYRKNIEGDVKTNIAKWKIKVNDELIANKEKLVNNITPTFTGNEYISSNLIAPGVEGYYDINIDASKVDLDFDYKIISSVSDDSTVRDLITTGYEINPTDEKNILEYNEEGITGTIKKNTEETIIRIYIKWNDDTASETMDNKKDTQVGSSDVSTCIMKVNFNFTQKNNE